MFQMALLFFFFFSSMQSLAVDAVLPHGALAANATTIRRVFHNLVNVFFQYRLLFLLFKEQCRSLQIRHSFPSLVLNVCVVRRTTNRLTIVHLRINLS